MPSFSPEYWEYLPFGLNIDPYGGKSTPLEEFIIVPKGEAAKTSLGLVDCRFYREKFCVSAKDLGMNLFYGKDGKLDALVVDLYPFCINMTDKEVEKMGGDNLIEMLQMMEDDGKRYSMTFNLEDSLVALVSRDQKTGRQIIEASVENVDMAEGEAVVFTYEGFSMLWVTECVDDEFGFGTQVLDYDISGMTPKLSFMMSRVLSDCNYQTFLDSKAQDRIDKLTKRIFLVS